METARDNLINAVQQEQDGLRMSDRKFSMQVLGISPSYYCLLKSGKRPLTLNLLTIFMQKLPRVTPQVTVFFMDQGGDGKNRKTIKKSGGEIKGVIPKCITTAETP